MPPNTIELLSDGGVLCMVGSSTAFMAMISVHPLCDSFLSNSYNARFKLETCAVKSIYIWLAQASRRVYPSTKTRIILK